jgi:hypothetical protein
MPSVVVLFMGFFLKMFGFNFVILLKLVFTLEFKFQLVFKEKFKCDIIISCSVLRASSTIITKWLVRRILHEVKYIITV